MSSLSLSPKASQSTVVTNRQVQSLAYLSASVTDLHQLLRKEQEQNPVITVSEHEQPPELDDVESLDEYLSEVDNQQLLEEHDEALKVLEYINDSGASLAQDAPVDVNRGDDERVIEALSTDDELSYVITPEARVWLDKQFNVMVEVFTEHEPRIGFSREYLRMYQHTEDASTKEWLLDKITSVNDIKHFMKRRVITLNALLRAVFNRQRNFLARGFKALKPMSMEQVGGDIGFSEATVSRCVANKFVETPQGLVCVRHLFSQELDGCDGKMDIKFSTLAVKVRIAELIKSSPFNPTDMELVNQLAREGVNISRRTVNKYRNMNNL